MGANDLNQRYTIEKYCTKMEVAKSLGTNLIEPIWKEILDFRNRLSIVLPIFDTAHVKFFLTYIDLVQGKSSQVNDLLSIYISSYSKLKKGSIADYTFSHDMLKICLKNVAKLNKIDVSEITLTNIVEDKETDPELGFLANYKKALMDFENNSLSEINEDFLAQKYAILRGEQELTSFYRTSDNLTSDSKALVDRLYDQGVPAHLIEDMMNSLMEYINNGDISLLSRLVAIFFMFNYVKPFEKFNLELATLTAKKVIAMSEANSSSLYIPFEELLTNKNFINEVTRESIKTHDFTYALVEAAPIICNALETANERIEQVHAHALDTEAKLGTDVKKIKEEFGVSIETPVIQASKIETKAQIQERIEKKYENIPQEQVSEKELKARMNDILESNPFIKKSQAHFYVHHCTIGKFYTIQQFIKFENCVYETGRTSMDNLAKHGYYRREQIKNKFVYTPINKE